jgi:hypothetical protein
MRMGLAASTLALSFATARCAWVTDLSSSGYTLVDAGLEAGAGSCASAADCDGGELCCVSPASASSTFTLSCASSCSPVVGSTAIQVCMNGAECPGSECLLQTCLNMSVMACRVASICTPATALDASLALDATAPIAIVDASFE